MRKHFFHVLVLICLLTGCSSQTSASPTSNASVVEHPFGGNESQPVSARSQNNNTPVSIDAIHASDLLALFQKEGLPIGAHVEYTQSTDPNGLLGQSNSYIEKIDFADTRLQDETQQNAQPVGGTIEIFRTAEDAKDRYTYLNNVTSSSVLSMYMYQHQTIVIRLEKRLSETQAQEYERVLSNLENGQYK